MKNYSGIKTALHQLNVLIGFSSDGKILIYLGFLHCRGRLRFEKAGKRRKMFGNLFEKKKNRSIKI